MTNWICVDCGKEMTRSEVFQCDKCEDYFCCDCMELHPEHEAVETVQESTEYDRDDILYEQSLYKDIPKV